MILGIGTDIIEIVRIENIVKHTPTFIKKVFTEKENLHFRSKSYKSETVAGIFAAKEAISKAFGTGFRTIMPTDIEILPNDLGKPEVTLYNEAIKLGEQLGVMRIHVTISHCKTYAVAYAIVEGGK